MRLPLDEFLDYKKLRMRQLQPKETIVKTDQSCLLLNIQDMTRIESMFVVNPNKDIIEDRPL